MSAKPRGSKPKDKPKELTAADVLDHYLVCREEFMQQVSNNTPFDQEKLDRSLAEYEEAQQGINKLFYVRKVLTK